MLRLRTSQSIKRLAFFGIILFPLFLLLINQQNYENEDTGLQMDRTKLSDYKNETHSVINETLSPKTPHRGYSTRYAAIQDIPSFTVKEVSCQKLFQQNYESFILADKIQQNIIRDANRSLEDLSSELADCKRYRERFINVPINKEEEEFPLAFSMLLYKDLDQAARLLRAIYRPQNYYCLHVDASSSEELYETTTKLVRCFDNVILASKRINVVWGWYSVVEPDVLCMQELWKYKKWKYFINLTGQEFPLHTNLELVHTLKSYKGANDIQAVLFNKVPSAVRDRLMYSYRDRDLPANNGSGVRTRTLKHPFGHNVTWAKGQPHVAVTRQYVDFLLHNKVAEDLREWIADTAHASEHLFNPLQLSPQLGVPGAYTGKLQRTGGHARLKIWDHQKDFSCRGKYSRSICIISIRDLWQLDNTAKMFVNKLHADYNPLAYSCLEERIFENVKKDVMGENRLDLSVYEKSDFVRHHLT